MDIKIDIKGLEKIKKITASKVVDKAVNSTVNKLGKQSVTAINKEIRSDFVIKASDIRKRMFLHKSTPRTLTATVGISTKKIGLTHFKVAEVRRSKKKTKGGVQAQVKRSGGKKTIKHAFMSVMPNTGHGVWMRKKKEGGKFVSRLPIRRLTGPSVKGMAQSTNAEKVIGKVINDKGQKIFDNALKYYVNKEERL